MQFLGVASRPKLLDRVRLAIRSRHYSRRSEQAYVHWIRHFIVFHDKRHPSKWALPKSHSTCRGWRPSGASARQPRIRRSAPCSFSTSRLHIDVGPIDHVPRAKMPVRLPVVLSREEVGRLLGRLPETTWLLVALLYGAGLRLQECLELRVKDLDFDQHQIVRSPFDKL